jgi:hypothetical protein
MYKLETKPLIVFGVFKSSWQLYKSVIFYILPITTLLTLAYVIPSYFGYIGLYRREPNNPFTFSTTALVFFLLLLIIEAYLIAVLFYTIYLHATETKIDHLVPYRYAAKILWPFYFVLLIYYAATDIGFAYIFLPAIFIAVLLSMCIPYALLEKQGLMALVSSARLVWGHWWQTFIALALPFFLIYIARNIIKFTSLMGKWPFVVDTIFLILFSPYYYSVLFVQFMNLKTIRALPEPIKSEPRPDLPT